MEWLDPEFEYNSGLWQFAVVRFEDGVREIHMIERETAGANRRRILTNKIETKAHYDKYFAINRDTDARILDLLLTLGIIEQPNSVIFTRNGSVTVYRLKGTAI